MGLLIDGSAFLLVGVIGQEEDFPFAGGRMDLNPDPVREGVILWNLRPTSSSSSSEEESRLSKEGASI
jgi:hypothetical protein